MAKSLAFRERAAQEISFSAIATFGACIARITRYRDELSPKTAISLMAQYYATNTAATDPRYILLSRRITEGEWFQAISLLDELGMDEGFMQEYESASHYYRPDFNDAEKPSRTLEIFNN